MIAGQVPGIDREIEALAQGAAYSDAYEAYHALEGRFVADDNGVVVDTKTGLQWFVGPDINTTWDEAKSWVESLAVDGGQWRMPTRDELSSLYSKGAGSHNMTPLLKTTGGYVWTGETVGSSYAWGFCFDIGDAYWPRRTYSETARAFAVRSMER
jgi:hypothetical protein